MKEQEYLYWLCQVPAVGAVAIHRLYERYGSFRAVYHMEGSRLAEEGLMSRKGAEAFDRRKPALARDAEEYASLDRRRIRFISMLDQGYPKRLRHIFAGPAGLYVKGRLPDDDRPSAAIIGSRTCSAYGYQMARMLGACLSREGIQIVSGLALGADGAGHEGALRSGGSTFGVLGSGVDVCYPASHLSLYGEMQERGGVISEFPLRTRALAAHFPIRNRIISGLSDLVIVVEARRRSGSLITAELALEQGKDVFAVPGMVTEELSRGCNELIRQGAGVVTSPDDVLEYFRIRRDGCLKVREKGDGGLAKEEKKVYSCLDLRPKFIEQVAAESGLPLSECMTILLELELRGFVFRTGGHYYVRTM